MELTVIFKTIPLVAVLVCTLLAAVAIAQEQLPEGPGRQTVLTVCSACHDLDTAIGMRRTRDAWQSAVDAMVNRGARATDEELKMIVEYLAKYFGVANVNKATARELQDVLELSAEQADAIVRYRVENSDFTDLQSLKKVPGVDAKLLEERKDRIVFK